MQLKNGGSGTGCVCVGGWGVLREKGQVSVTD